MRASLPCCVLPAGGFCVDMWCGLMTLAFLFLCGYMVLSTFGMALGKHMYDLRGFSSTIITHSAHALLHRCTL